MSTTDADSTGDGATEQSGAGPDSESNQPAGESASPDATSVSRVGSNACTIKRRNVDRAIRRLEATGDVTDAQRETVEALADAIVAGVLEDPLRVLSAAVADDDAETVSTATALLLDE